MIYFLIFILMFEMIFVYLINKRRILSPTLIACGMFLLSLIIYAFYKNNYYGRDLQSNIILSRDRPVCGLSRLSYIRVCEQYLL